MLGPFAATPNEPLVPLIDWRPGEPTPLLLSGPEEMLEDSRIPASTGILASTFRTKKEKRRKRNKHARKSRAKNR